MHLNCQKQVQLRSSSQRRDRLDPSLRKALSIVSGIQGEPVPVVSRSTEPACFQRPARLAAEAQPPLSGAVIVICSIQFNYSFVFYCWRRLQRAG